MWIILQIETMETGKKSTEEIINGLKEQDLFKNLDKEALKYIDNIVSNILELRRMNSSAPFSGSGWIWLILMMFIFSSLFGNTPMYGIEPREDTENKELSHS